MARLMQGQFLKRVDIVTKPSASRCYTIYLGFSGQKIKNDIMINVENNCKSMVMMLMSLFTYYVLVSCMQQQ